MFKGSFVFFMSTIYLLSGLNILGYNIPIDVWIPTMVGVLFLVLGNYMPKIKNNWFMGIRTPWTLSSEEVWNKTHRLAGKTFIAGGVVMIAMNFFPLAMQMPIFFIMIAIMVLVPMIYSYLLFSNEQKQKNTDQQS